MGNDFDADGEAAALRRMAHELEDCGDPLVIAKRLGLRVKRRDGAFMKGQHAFLHWEDGPTMSVLKSLPWQRKRWAVGHELGEYRLKQLRYMGEDIERRAHEIAAALLMPRRAFVSRARAVPVEQLALDFRVDQTAASLRLGETRIVEAAVVVTPSKTYARGEEGFVLPADGRLREIARAPHGYPGLRKVRLTDDPRRIAMFAGVT